MIVSQSHWNNDVMLVDISLVVGGGGAFKASLSQLTRFGDDGSNLIHWMFPNNKITNLYGFQSMLRRICPGIGSYLCSQGDCHLSEAYTDWRLAPGVTGRYPPSIWSWLNCHQVASGDPVLAADGGRLQRHGLYGLFKQTWNKYPVTSLILSDWHGYVRLTSPRFRIKF